MSRPSQPEFRIYEANPLAVALVNSEGMDVSETASHLKEAAQFVGPIACLATYPETHSMQLRFVNYPRGKFGQRGQSEIFQTAQAVARTVDGELGTPRYRSIGTAPLGRVVFGLRQGYTGEELPLGDVRDYVMQNLSYRLDSPRYERARVFSVTPDTAYQERAVQIDFMNKGQLSAVLSAAMYFKQERISLEAPRHRRAFMIETNHCTEPDTLPSVAASKSHVASYLFRRGR